MAWSLLASAAYHETCSAIFCNDVPPRFVSPNAKRNMSMVRPRSQMKINTDGSLTIEMLIAARDKLFEDSNRPPEPPMRIVSQECYAMCFRILDIEPAFFNSCPTENMIWLKAKELGLK